MKTTRLAIIVSALALLALFAGCTQDPTAGHATRTATIGPEGGSLTSADGRARVDIPEGAVQRDIEFSVAPSSARPPIRYGQAVGVGYTFSPSMHFSAPVRIMTDVDPHSMPVGSEANLVIRDGATGRWSELQEVTVDLAEGWISGTSYHFSTVVTVASDRAAQVLGEPPFITPVPRTAFVLTQGFEVLDESVRHHSALDIGAPRGTTVRSVADGWVALLQRNHPGGRDLGNTIVVGHLLPDGRTVYSLSAHLQAGGAFDELLTRVANNSGCRQGQDGGPFGSNSGQYTCAQGAVPTSQGQPIGRVGNSAQSNVGNHLHFAIQTFPHLTSFDASGNERNPRVYTAGYPTAFGYLDPQHFWQPTVVYDDDPTGRLTGHRAVRVIEGRNHLRTGAGTNHTIITSVTGGTTLYRIAAAESDDGVCPTWLQVTRTADFTEADGLETSSPNAYAAAYFKDEYGSDGRLGQGYFRTGWICADLVEAVDATPPPPSPPPPSPPPPSPPPPSNESPHISSFDDDGDATAGDRVEFDWRVSDPDGDELTCVIDFDDGHDREVDDCAGTVSLSHRFDEEGTYRVRLEVTDGRGGEDAASVPVRISEAYEPPPPPAPPPPSQGPVITHIDPETPVATMDPQTVKIYGYGFVRGLGVLLTEEYSGRTWDMAEKADYGDSNYVVLTGVVFGYPPGRWEVTVRNHPGTGQEEDSNTFSFWTE